MDLIRHFRNEEGPGASIISQWLVESLVGTKSLFVYWFASSNGPRNQYKMTLVPGLFSFLKWRIGSWVPGKSNLQLRTAMHSHKYNPAVMEW